MGAITDAFAAAWADYNTPGVPASGFKKPPKADIRAIGPLIEAAISGDISTFDTLAAAQAGTIDASIDFVEVLSYQVATDRWHRFFRRVAAQPAHHLKFQSADGAWWDCVNPRKLILCTGQSNMQDVYSRPTFSAPANYWLWNWNRTEAGVGTAFARHTGTNIGTGVSFVAELARKDPDTDFMLVNIAFGGMPIDHWIDGIRNYNFSTLTTNTGMATAYGNVRFNNATPASATTVFIHQGDATFATTAQTRVGALTVALGSSKVRIYKVSDPTVWVEFDPGTNTTVSNWYECPITGVSSNGTLVDGDAVAIKSAPDILAVIIANLGPARTQLGVTKIDALGFRQGEGDSVEPKAWDFNFEQWIGLLSAQGFIDQSVPIIIWGQVNEALSGIAQYGRMAYFYQKAVQRSPSTRIYIDTAGTLNNAAFWQDTFNIHNNGLGQEIAGKLGAEALVGFAGSYSSPKGLVTHPENSTLRLLVDGTLAEPALAWLDDQDTGFNRPGPNQIGIVCGGVQSAIFGAGGFAPSFVAFPAVQVPSADANTLDDYEEGTFTPTLLFSGGNTGMTFSTQLGRYVKIGQAVYFTIALVLTAKGTSTGALTLGGLPFAAASGINQPVGSVMMQATLTNWGDTHVAGLLASAATAITLYKASTTTIAGFADTDIGNTTTIYASGMYRANQ